MPRRNPKFPAGEKHVDQIVPPSTGLWRIGSNQVSIEQHHTLGRNVWSCANCGARFNRPYSHVARNENPPCCSRSCWGEYRSKLTRVATNCVVCGKEMLLPQSSIGKIVSCSRRCQSLKMRKDNTPAKHLYTYRDAERDVRKRGNCETCGAPDATVVRDIVANEYDVDASKARLICRHCYGVEIAPVALAARKDKRGY